MTILFQTRRHCHPIPWQILLLGVFCKQECGVIQQPPVVILQAECPFL